jgi:SAM-dependent methyltransferase
MMTHFIAFGVLSLFLAPWGFCQAVVAQSPASAEPETPKASGIELPDHYHYVAADILDYCKPRKGVWVDLGAGTGSVTFAVAAKDHAAAQQSTFVFLDPDREALATGLDRAEAAGLAHRVAAVVGKAEDMPLPSGSVDLVFSRGSIFFWDDPVKDLQEVYRVLRPGGEAMIGGGRGSKNPRLAQQEPKQEQKDKQDEDQIDLSKLSDFPRLRHPKTFRKWGEDAGIREFEVIGRGASSGKEHCGGRGIWLRFTKQEAR